MREDNLKKGKFQIRKQTITGYAFLAPFLTLFTIFTILPIAVSIVLSFTYFNGFSMPDFVGLSNYIKLFLSDELFMKALSNTLVFAMITGPLSYLLCLVLAWIISEFSPKIRSVLTLLFYAPSICGSAYLIFTVIFSGDRYGWVNAILMKLNIIYKPIDWIKDPDYMFPVALIVILWSSLGSSFLSFIAGFLNIDRNLYEAGAIDGIRSRWQELRYITLPCMSHMLLFSAVMQIQSSFSVSAIAIELAGFPSTQYAADTIVSHMTDMATVRFEYGYASAIAIILFAMMAVSRLVIGKVLSMAGR